MTFVLIPGAGGESQYWKLVAARLRGEVVAPDLPCGDEAAGLAEYADVVVDAADGRPGVTIVAQSMGAYPATMACERIDVARLILVVPMIPAPGETPGEWWAASGQSAARRENERREGRDPDAPFDLRTGFFHDVPAELTEEILAGPEPPQADRPFRDPWPLAAWPDVPTRVIAGRYDRLFPLEFMRRLARERVGVEPEVIDSGHLPALSRPDELARLLQS
jgi:pimeloyl-ACP methyl ester carboxylesterase